MSTTTLVVLADLINSKKIASGPGGQQEIQSIRNQMQDELIKAIEDSSRGSTVHAWEETHHGDDVRLRVTASDFRELTDSVLRALSLVLVSSSNGRRFRYTVFALESEIKYAPRFNDYAKLLKNEGKSFHLAIDRRVVDFISEFVASWYRQIKKVEHTLEFGDGESVPGAYVDLCCDIGESIPNPPWTSSGGTESKLFVKSYPRSQDRPFFEEVKQLLPKASRITLIATGLNLIWESDVLDILLERASSGDANINICLGNPFNLQVQNRLIEEEMNRSSPTEGRRGITKRVRDLLRLLEHNECSERISVSLFEHYPTFATLIFDKDIFVYPYAYKSLGTVSPILHFLDNGSAEASFFTDNANKILEDAVPARDVIYSRSSQDEGVRDNWIAAAVFLIPPASHPFYKLGAGLLGYDIHEEEQLSTVPKDVPDIRGYVGEAEQYGFHLTVADALYFANWAEIKRVKAELNFLCDEFSPISLTGLRVSDRFRDSTTLVCECDDDGAIESLHSELVLRLYRMACSSTYRAGITTKRKSRNKSGGRFQFMLDRYGAPFILREFVPHFTLCNDFPKNAPDRETLVNQLQKCVKKSTKESIEISEICLVTKKHDDSHWKILDRFNLDRD